MAKKIAAVLVLTGCVMLAGCTAGTQHSSGSTSAARGAAPGRGATVAVADLGDGFSEATPQVRADYAAAHFAESLRHSPYGDEVNLPDLAAIASSTAERTGDPVVAYLATLIGRADG